MLCPYDMPTSFTSWLWRWGPAVVVMALIFIASGTPGRDLPSFGFWDTLVKKGGHMTGYALLAASYLHALARSRTAACRAVIFALLLAVGYAATDEFHQSFTPGRTPSLRDVGIDGAGAAIGAGFWMIANRAARSRSTS